jgi:predicted TPR repeat methyltransferase
VAGPSQQDIEKVAHALERRIAVDPRLQDLLTAEPRTALALTRYWIQLANAGQSAPAREMLEMALLLQPDEPIIWYSLGMVQNAAGAHRDAVESYRRSVALEPRQAEAWSGIGFALAQLEEYEPASEAYGRALAIKPDLARVRHDLGVVRLRQRRYTEAVGELRQAAMHESADAALFANLAVALFQSGAVTEAAEAYERVRALDPSLAGTRENRAFVAFIERVMSGSVDGALIAYRANAEVATIDRPALFKAALAYLVGQGWSDHAAAVARAWLTVSPDDPEPAFALLAAKGDRRVDRAPEAYIVSHFDSFADSFDQKLVGELNYRVPETLAQFLRRHIARPSGLRILDLGCGTGLSGVPLRPLASELVGVDLAPRMIEKARARRLYDTLAVGEVLAFLAAADRPFDVVVAADLVIYFGDLAPLVAAARRVLEAGGLLALSAETCAGEGWSLLPSGRFAHSLAYLDSLAGDGMRVRDVLPTTVRFEGTADVPGAIYLYEKIGA